MNYFRQMNKKVRTIWFLILTISILLAQGIKYHIHSIAQEHHHSIDSTHDSIEKLPEHFHFTQVHSANNNHDNLEHDNTLEFEVKSNGILNKISVLSFLLDLLFILVSFTIFINLSHATIRYRRNHKAFLSYWRYLLAPPLRAPPA